MLLRRRYAEYELECSYWPIPMQDASPPVSPNRHLYGDIAELLPSDRRWWEFNDDPQWSALAVFLGLINLLYVGAALTGLVRTRFVTFSALLLTFVVLRSAFLGTLENPEPRYTLECFPAVIWSISALFTLSSRRDLLPKVE